MLDKLKERSLRLIGRRVFIVSLVCAVAGIRPDIGWPAAVLVGTVAIAALLGITRTDIEEIGKVIGKVAHVIRGGEET